MKSTTKNPKSRKTPAKTAASGAAPSTAAYLNEADLASIQKIFTKRYNSARSLAQNQSAFRKSLTTAMSGFTIPT